MDLHIPEMDGYSATKEIRKESRWKKLPIIALTASAELETREQIRAVGMNDFISKPFNPSDILNQLHVWLGTWAFVSIHSKLFSVSNDNAKIVISSSDRLVF